MGRRDAKGGMGHSILHKPSPTAAGAVPSRSKQHIPILVGPIDNDDDVGRRSVEINAATKRRLLLVRSQIGPAEPRGKGTPGSPRKQPAIMPLPGHGWGVCGECNNSMSCGKKVTSIIFLPRLTSFLLPSSATDQRYHTPNPPIITCLPPFAFVRPALALPPETARFTRAQSHKHVAQKEREKTELSSDARNMCDSAMHRNRAVA